MRTQESNPARSEIHWDAIVIGSGMGGLAAAATLSRVGHKAPLLEQYQTLGGLTHSFSRNGFSWDVGLHYLSGVAPGEPERALLDWLCDCPIDLAPMGTIDDVLHIGSADPLLLSRPCEAQILDLKERFPDESKAIDTWFEAVHKGREAAILVLFLPANIYASVNSVPFGGNAIGPSYRYVRVLFQLFLIWWTIWSTRSSGPGTQRR